MAETGPRVALLVVDDLLFESKIREVMDQMGIPYRTARTSERFCARLESDRVRIAFVDLARKPALEPLMAIRFIRTTPGIEGIPVIAFGQHVDTDELAEARELGCDEVLTRSELEEQLPELVLAYAEALGDPARTRPIYDELLARKLAAVEAEEALEAAAHAEAEAHPAG